MGTIRVASEVLEHILDLPENIKISDITSAEEERTFVFHLEGEHPVTGEKLEGEYTALYSQDEAGTHFEGLEPA